MIQHLVFYSRCMLYAGLLLLLTSCSSAQFGYRFLDDLMHWEIDKYLDLDSEQTDWLRRRLDGFHDWHRREQLPLYVNFLETQAKRLEQPTVSAAELQKMMDQGYGLIRQSTQQLLPDLAELAAGLSDEQVTVFLRNYDRKAREYAEEHILPAQAKRRESRMERMEEMLGKWIGKLDAEQQPLLEKWADRLDYATGPRLAQRSQFRQTVEALLKQRADPVRFKAGLQKLVVFPEQQYLPEYRQYEATNRRQTLNFLAELSGTLTAGQRQTLLGNLQRYQRDFERLAVQ